MAKLREQKRIVEVILKFPSTQKPFEYPLEGKELDEFFKRNSDASQGMVSDDNLMKYCAIIKIFNNDKLKNLTNLSDEEKIIRKHNINNLVRSCWKSGFIEAFTETEEFTDWKNANTSISFDDLPRKNEEIVKGWTTTDKGTDLLFCWGFMSTFFEKYEKLTIFLYSSLSGAAGVSIFWCIYTIYNLLRK